MKEIKWMVPPFWAYEFLLDSGKKAVVVSFSIMEARRVCKAFYGPYNAITGVCPA